MSVIREINVDQLELFSLSLVSVSKHLYGKIIAEVKKKYGRIGRITKKTIAKIMFSRPEQFSKVVVALKRKLELSVAIDDILPETGLVKVGLVFPISGESAQVEKLLSEAAKEVGIAIDNDGLSSEAPKARGNSLVLPIFLNGSSKPYRVIHPNPINGGRGQKYFIAVVEKYPSLH